MNRLLSLQAKLKNFPFGKSIFSYLVARNDPYFLSIKPHILTLESHLCKVRMRRRRSVENHIRTVHAIAMCNLCELAGGLCLEATIPKSHRWIPAGMEVAYLKKATTDLIATCQLGEIDWDNCKEVICHVSVKDTHDIEVMTADIRMKVSPKKR